MLTPIEISVIQDLAEQGKSQVKISELTGFSCQASSELTPEGVVWRYPALDNRVERPS